MNIHLVTNLGLCLLIFIQCLKTVRCERGGGIVFNDEDDEDYIVESPAQTRGSTTLPNATFTNFPIGSIPLSLAKKLSQVQTAEDLLQFLGNAKEVDVNGRKTIVAIGSNWEEDYEISIRQSERNSIVQAQPANCKPELVTIELINNPNPSVFYFPTCTRIERCGGCCSSELLSCEPTKTETVFMQIMKVEYRGGRSQNQAPMRLAGKEVVPVQKHTECKCDCRVKASDCNKLQTFNHGDCKCSCTNVEEMKKCEGNFPVKFWDSTKCFCVCRDIKVCSSGYNFDLSTCKCEMNPVRRNTDDVYSYQGSQAKPPVWIDETRNLEKNQKKLLQGDKEEKSTATTNLNLWQQLKNRNNG